MEQKKRLFSGFDLFVILLVLLEAGTWFWMTNRSAQEEAIFQGGRATYFIEVGNLTQEQLYPVQIGDSLLESSRHLPLGQIIDISIRPFELRVDDWETQTIRFEDVTDRYTLILTIETTVEETEQDILTEGGFAIKGGRPVSFAGPGYTFGGGVILGLDRGA